MGFGMGIPYVPKEQEDFSIECALNNVLKIYTNTDNDFNNLKRNIEAYLSCKEAKREYSMACKKAEESYQESISVLKDKYGGDVTKLYL